MAKITETATSIVSLLGGPQITSEDIDWALDLPAGQRLLDWLVSQVEIPGSPANENTDASLSRAAAAAALHAVALDDGEIQMLRHATKKPATAVDRYAITGAEIDPTIASGYIVPWRLRAKEEYALAEAARLEAETETLKARLQQAKIASQSLTQALKFLASEIETTESDIQATESGLSELSLQTDAAILGSVNASLILVDKCKPDDSVEDESLLTVACSVRATATDRFRQHMQAIDTAERHLPSSTELIAECGCLETALRKTSADLLLNRELARLCTTLENPDTGKDALAAVLAERPRLQTQLPSINVAAELEAAWARDQVALLDARAAVLDEAIAAFSDSVLPPLTTLHNNLAAQNTYTGEAQAYIGALSAEIQDTVEALRAAQESQPKPSTSSAEETQDMELQVGLTSLLEQLKDLRPQAAPPLVLLSQEDILTELRDIYGREKVSRRQEGEWMANLLPTLRNLETAHAPLLNASYAHSPLNSSAPFSVPTDVHAVSTDAKNKADALGNAISKLQEHVKGVTNDRAKRKMEQFISKWTN